MLNLTNNIKKIVAVVAIAVTLLFAIEAPSEAAPQFLEIPSILTMDSMELAATLESDLTQPLAESNLLAEATAKGKGCKGGSWCCDIPGAKVYACTLCTTKPCLKGQEATCKRADGQEAPNRKCNAPY